MKPILVEDEARAEIDDAATWYEQRQTGLGRRYLQAVDKTVRQIAQFPRAGARVPRVPADLGVRRVPLEAFPYLIVYLDTPRAIHILAAAHERRRPNYWLSRAGTRERTR